MVTYQPRKGGVRIHHPIEDFNIPNQIQMQSILLSIQSGLENGGKVYVHCKAGIGRTGTVAAVWLIEQGLSPDKALLLLLQKWQCMDKFAAAPHTPETDAQRKFVRTWQQTG
jgi:protein-tyrosine phosphatase